MCCDGHPNFIVIPYLPANKDIDSSGQHGYHVIVYITVEKLSQIRMCNLLRNNVLRKIPTENKFYILFTIYVIDIH